MWTSDGGVTWHKTKEGVGAGFTGAAGTLWWWRGGAVYKAAAWPPGKRGIRRKFVTRVKGAIVDAKPTAAGIVVLVTNRVGGLGLDNKPRLLFVEHGKRRVVTLPKAPGDVLVRSLEVAWPQITVNAADVTGFARRLRGSRRPGRPPTAARPGASRRARALRLPLAGPSRSCSRPRNDSVRRFSPSGVSRSSPTRASESDDRRERRPARTARSTSSVTVLWASSIRRASSPTVASSSPRSDPFTSSSSKYHWGVSSASRATSSERWRKLRSATRNAAARCASSTEGVFGTRRQYRGAMRRSLAAAAGTDRQADLARAGNLVPGLWPLLRDASRALVRPCLSDASDPAACPFDLGASGGGSTPDDTWHDACVQRESRRSSEQERAASETLSLPGRQVVRALLEVGLELVRAEARVGLLDESRCSGDVRSRRRGPGEAARAAGRERAVDRRRDRVWGDEIWLHAPVDGRALRAVGLQRPRGLPTRRSDGERRRRARGLGDAPRPRDARGRGPGRRRGRTGPASPLCGPP